MVRVRSLYLRGRWFESTRAYILICAFGVDIFQRFEYNWVVSVGRKISDELMETADGAFWDEFNKEDDGDRYVVVGRDGVVASGVRFHTEKRKIRV